MTQYVMQDLVEKIGLEDLFSLTLWQPLLRRLEIQLIPVRIENRRKRGFIVAIIVPDSLLVLIVRTLI